MSDNNLSERVHKMEVEIAHFKTNAVRTDKKLGRLYEKFEAANEKHTKKLDKLATRLTIITAFAGGVLFVSSETGGNVLRSLLGGF